MSNIIPFTHDAQLPAHVAALFEGVESNVASKQSIDQLSYRGKTWRLVLKGEETALTKTNADGDQEPIPSVKLVVLAVNKGRSRAFYRSAYDGSKNAAPDCASADGVAPDADIAEPCSATCASCPNSVKGSRITDNGKQTTACSTFKRVAVVPSNAIGTHAPLLLRMAQTSVWDGDNGENEAKGWYAWDQYCDMLRARGVKHTAAVETRAKFDLRVEYPKLLFSAARWLDEVEAVAAKGRIEKDAEALAAILTGGRNDGVMGRPVAGQPAGGNKTPEPTLVDDSAVKKAAAAAKKKADAEVKAKAAAELEAAAAKAKTVAAEADDDEDDGFGAIVDARVAKTAAKPAAKSAPAPEKAAVLTSTPSGLNDLLSGWDD